LTSNKKHWFASQTNALRIYSKEGNFIMQSKRIKHVIYFGENQGEFFFLKVSQPTV
jgi:hypothetical protein